MANLRTHNDPFIRYVLKTYLVNFFSLVLCTFFCTGNAQVYLKNDASFYVSDGTTVHQNLPDSITIINKSADVYVSKGTLISGDFYTNTSRIIDERKQEGDFRVAHSINKNKKKLNNSSRSKEKKVQLTYHISDKNRTVLFIISKQNFSFAPSLKMYKSIFTDHKEDKLSCFIFHRENNMKNDLYYTIQSNCLCCNTQRGPPQFYT